MKFKTKLNLPVYYILLPLIIIIFFYVNNSIIVYNLIKTKGNLSIRNVTKNLNDDFIYAKNQEFIINNNVAQYSSYIIIDKDESNNTVNRIEALVKINDYFIKASNKDDFICVLKSSEILVEINTTEMPKLFREKEVKKLIFNIGTEITRFLKIDIEENLNRLLLAVIFKNDFNKNLEMNDFNVSNDRKNSFILPYSLINFQKPTIIRPIEPRLPSVSYCVHYVYRLPEHLINCTVKKLYEFK